MLTKKTIVLEGDDIIVQMFCATNKENINFVYIKTKQRQELQVGYNNSEKVNTLIYE